MHEIKRYEEIPLIRPAVPAAGDLLPYLERILGSRQLTNGGPVHEEFEQALCRAFGVEYISLFANGTLALTIALKALRLEGEVITTPFTSPSTLQAIHWNNLRPVFADIDPDDLNIDPSAIEKVISPDTCAILPVHIFGTPCRVGEIGELAWRHKLSVVYDAAHSFGVEVNGRSVCRYGDLSVLSFHATKVFNTIEGGAIVCRDAATKKYIDALKNTGIGPDHRLAGHGLNAKMNEVQAAFGLCQLETFDRVLAGRALAVHKYRELLEEVGGVRMIREMAGVRHNHSYLPVIIDPAEFGANRDELSDYLDWHAIRTRKYFHPLVNDFPEFASCKTGDLPVARSIAANILCLPLFHDISQEQVERVAMTVRQFKHISHAKACHLNRYKG